MLGAGLAGGSELSGSTLGLSSLQVSTERSCFSTSVGMATFATSTVAMAEGLSGLGGEGAKGAAARVLPSAFGSFGVASPGRSPASRACSWRMRKWCGVSSPWFRAKLSVAPGESSLDWPCQMAAEFTKIGFEVRLVTRTLELSLGASTSAWVREIMLRNCGDLASKVSRNLDWCCRPKCDFPS